MVKVLNEAIAGSIADLPQIIEKAKRLSDFWPTMKSRLYAKPSIVSNSPAACQLLAIALENESTIDLSPFQLSADQITMVLRRDSPNSESLVDSMFVWKPSNLGGCAEGNPGKLLKY